MLSVKIGFRRRILIWILKVTWRKFWDFGGVKNDVKSLVQALAWPGDNSHGYSAWERQKQAYNLCSEVTLLSIKGQKIVLNMW